MHILPDKYRYVITLFRGEEHTVLGHVPVEVDFQPALEWALFQGVRRRQLPPAMPAAPLTCIEPLWNGTVGEPYTRGFRVRIASHGSETAHDFASAYFAGLAQTVSGPFIQRGELVAGETFRYLVSAFPSHPETDADSSEERRPLAIRSKPPPFVITNAPRDAACLRQAAGAAPNDLGGNDGDLPVYMPQAILDEIGERTQDAGSDETGGILIGKLLRDSGPATDLVLEITAQIPADHAHASTTRLTFTATTWTAVQAAIDLRRRDEMMLGWWHSHSFLKESCKHCEKNKNQTCTADAAFLSATDVALHHTVFPRAYSLALVVSDGPCSGLKWRLFGWRDGVVAPRDFNLLDSPEGDAVPTTGREPATACHAGETPRLATDSVR